MSSFEFGNEPDRTLEHGYIQLRILALDKSTFLAISQKVESEKINPVVMQLSCANVVNAAFSFLETIRLFQPASVCHRRHIWSGCSFLPSPQVYR
jgi:hypothetical protein